MKQLLYIFLLSSLCLPLRGQNFPSCDSLVIYCCTPDLVLPVSYYSLGVTNYSSVLFDYPGFVLFNSNMDTIAKEQVNYFGIGNTLQTHVLNSVTPVTLPFTGTLQLYTWFYDTLACSFPVTVLDVAIGLAPDVSDNKMHLYPNPAPPSGKISISMNSEFSEINIRIYNIIGAFIKSEMLTHNHAGSAEVDVSALQTGMYFLHVESNGKHYTAKFIK